MATTEANYPVNQEGNYEYEFAKSYFHHTFLNFLSVKFCNRKKNNRILKVQIFACYCPQLFAY